MKKAIYEPTPKMIDVWNNSDGAKYRLLEGPVRSSKSYTADTLAIDEIQALPPTNVLISGYSIGSVGRNVIAEWKEMIDPKGLGLFKDRREGSDHFTTINWRGLRNKKFYIRGAGKEHDYKQIQGGTFGYWYADEFTRHAKSFVNMAVTRQSPEFARGTWTTNADSPFHYVKVDYMDNAELRKPMSDGRAFLKHYHFTLRDNPSLTPEFIETLNRAFTGVFKKRYVDGLWILAEGLVYDIFQDGPPHVLDKTPKAKHYVVGIDYGTGNPSCFILFGVNPDTTPKIWAEAEYYYDSKVQEISKTDAEYSADLKDFLQTWIGSERPRGIYVDPSALSLKTQLRKDGFLYIKDAKNDVLNGIRTQATLLQTGKYAIHRRCKQTREDYGAYSWDPKAQLKGEDKPLKQHDHTKDPERYVLYTLYGEFVLDYSLLTKD